ncbi:MAG: protease modulator HflC [Verrucomicrobia bacterium]|nr:protease modulator HflC [Verrucomicrobiota bacterium]MCH8511157.1 protease modulator HflC [Kiritimatiellia bacterium]
MSASPKNSIAGGMLLVLLAVGGFLLVSSVYIIQEAEQAIVLQFGKLIGEPVTTPGIHFKIPFIQEVRRFDKRLMVWDGSPNQIPTLGREFISIDTTARWRIVDPLRFYNSVRDEAGAQARLDDIIDSAVRDQISATELTEIVRSEDWEITEEDLRQIDVVNPDSEDLSLTGETKIGRNALTRAILEDAGRDMPALLGIELVDVRIKRLNYIPSVREQVFQRMISERQRIAEQFRSEGQGEASRINGDTARQLATIRSEALRKAEVVRGEADAEATRVYNEAYQKEPEFYAFFRTLESYGKTLGKQTDLFIGSDSEYFRFLKHTPE